MEIIYSNNYACQFYNKLFVALIVAIQTLPHKTSTPPVPRRPKVQTLLLSHSMRTVLISIRGANDLNMFNPLP